MYAAVALVAIVAAAVLMWRWPGRPGKPRTFDTERLTFESGLVGSKFCREAPFAIAPDALYLLRGHAKGDAWMVKVDQ